MRNRLSSDGDNLQKAKSYAKKYHLSDDEFQKTWTGIKFQRIKDSSVSLHTKTLMSLIFKPESIKWSYEFGWNTAFYLDNHNFDNCQHWYVCFFHIISNRYKQSIQRH